VENESGIGIFNTSISLASIMPCHENSAGWLLTCASKSGLLWTIASDAIGAVLHSQAFNNK
jgi:hypothetical protein